MIRRPFWKSERIPTLEGPFIRDNSPFKRGKDERRLRVTIHERETEAGEKEALSLIRELVHVQEFDFADTRPGSEHHLTLDPALLEEDEICRYTIQGSQSVLTGICYARLWIDVARSHEQAAHEKELREDMLVAAIHESLNADLLVTTAPRL